jgi:hypothetical protein
LIFSRGEDRVRPLALALLLALVAPAAGAAQGAGPVYGQAIRASAALRLAAQQGVASRAVPRRVADGVLALRRSNRKNEGVTLMIVGGAAVLVGAIAGGGGGTVLIVGGVVCAGYGFYLHTE